MRKYKKRENIFKANKQERIKAKVKAKQDAFRLASKFKHYRMVKAYCGTGALAFIAFY